jgi:transcriptional regulator with XRE-family HTH domain
MDTTELDLQDWYGPEAATFGDRLAAAREAQGLSQGQLARNLGVRVTTLRAWEEDRSEPRANRLSMMAGVLNVSLMWLINGEGEGLDAPSDEPTELPADVNALLGQLRDMRSEMRLQAEKLGRLEKKLRLALKDG